VSSVFLLAFFSYLCGMRRFFNTAGPCREDWHYTLDPVRRLMTIRDLIEDRKYFILHAPRQVGKTTTIIALMHQLNAEGKYISLYINIEPAQAVRNDVKEANNIFMSSVEDSAHYYLPEAYWPSENCWTDRSATTAFRSFLSRWCKELPKPLVLFIDEADALIGDSLLSLLRQVRGGYAQRPDGFPHALVLIGLRDLRDYRIYSDAEKRYVLGGSAFNIKDKSLVMQSFTKEEVCTLYAQHTAATGQIFTDEALDLVFEQTQGQPWLVNAIGRELCFEEHKVQPPGRTIVPEDVHKAIEILILRRDTHLDQLADKLTEPRVARIVDTILSGESRFDPTDISNEDIQYVIDLGLVSQTEQGTAQIANPIYQEIIPRQLTWVEQVSLSEDPRWYVLPDGRLDIEKLLTRFVEFYRENGEMITQRKLYTESAHHLAFMAWLQRIVNGGGYVRREYGLGLKFIDLIVEFGPDKIPIELKAEKHFKRQPALDHVAGYAKRLSKTTAYLLIFRRTMTDPDLVGQRDTALHNGVTVHLMWF
jgi:AAA-like domain